MPRQSLQAASKKAAKQAKINQLDSFGSTKSDFFNEDDFNTTELIVGDFIKRVKTNIEQAGMIVTGRIADIQVQKVENGINIWAYPELIYQDKGVNGSRNKGINDGKGYTNKKPPVQPIQEWIDAKGLELNAYAVRENIYKDGIPAKKVYTKELPQIIDELGEAIAEFTVREMLK